uniref:Uncharacterized protein n=1 Tax=Anguilla anguilla TaxID=7936 RepID=A0A0E9XUQ4_ANGAN
MQLENKIHKNRKKRLKMQMETDAQMPRLTGLNKLHADWTEYECAAGQLKKNKKTITTGVKHKQCNRMTIQTLKKP